MIQSELILAGKPSKLFAMLNIYSPEVTTHNLFEITVYFQFPVKL